MTAATMALLQKRHDDAYDKSIDQPCKCLECSGNGETLVVSADFPDGCMEPCENCDATGWIDADGNPLVLEAA